MQVSGRVMHMSGFTHLGHSPAGLPESRLHNAHGEGAGCKEASTLQTRQLSMYNYSCKHYWFKIKIVHHVQSTCGRMYQIRWSYGPFDDILVRVRLEAQVMDEVDEVEV